jgi:nucleotide sugar dehydrogenase
MLENAFRFVNITFAQEFDEYCRRIGISAGEVTGLAATKPFGFMPFCAGPGIGGHCIAEDPYFLYEAMREADMQPRILEAAIANHEHRAGVIVERIVERLGGRPLEDKHVLLLGVSYKPEIADTRRSPALPILEALEREGATVDYADPYVSCFAGRAGRDLATLQPQDYDLAVLITAHRAVPLDALAEAGWPLMDLRCTRSPEQPAGPTNNHAGWMAGLRHLFHLKPAAEGGGA